MNLIKSGQVISSSRPEWHEDLAEVQQEYPEGLTYSCCFGHQSETCMSGGHMKKRGKYKTMRLLQRVECIRYYCNSQVYLAAFCLIIISATLPGAVAE